ncbi:VOC family protein [Paracoccus sp. S1E-3]|uniref:VOC family protein n=1 Tax=Paracoccus sp. S1E-3 TaxID=2756130 RepID=UPI0015EEC744|nr:VOC family protein [Paracoccus sp. S1E-3]MBA4490381.1 VOC family protein [Paracoccus sp. S1E-3]
MSYFQGRLIDHLHMRVTNYEKSRDFYQAILEALGQGDNIEHGRDWMCCDELFLDQLDVGDTPSRIHLCFQAADRAMVNAFYEAALATGGRDYGAPGLRDYHPGYYAAFVLDPDGNNIEAKFDERPLTRSAPVIEITT